MRLHPRLGPDFAYSTQNREKNSGLTGVLCGQSLQQHIEKDRIFCDNSGGWIRTNDPGLMNPML